MDTQFDIEVGEALYRGRAYSSNKLSSMITQLDEDIKSRLPMTSAEDLAVTAKSLAITTTSGKGLSIAQRYADFQYGNGLSGIYIDGQPLAGYIQAPAELSNYYKKTETSSSAQLTDKFNAVLTDVSGSGSGVVTVVSKNGQSVSAVYTSNAGTAALSNTANAITAIEQDAAGKITGVSGIVALTSHQSLSGYYKKSETSSCAEISSSLSATKDYLLSVCNPSYEFGELNTDPKEQHTEDGQPVRTYEIQLRDRTINKLYIQGNTPATTNYIDLILPEQKPGRSREFKLLVFTDNDGYAPKTWLRLITDQSGRGVEILIPFSYISTNRSAPSPIDLQSVKKAAATRWPSYFAALAGNAFGLGEEPSAQNLAEFINEMTDNAFGLNAESPNFLSDAFYAVQRDYTRVKKGTTIYQFNEVYNTGDSTFAGDSTFMLDVQSGDVGAFSIYNGLWPVGPNG